MSWTYVDPNTSARDAVRFLIGDTDSTDQLLQDNEISYLLNQYNQSVFLAAIRACETLMSKFTRQADEAVGSVNIKFSQKSKQFGILVTQLRSRFAIEGEWTPYAGGISVSDKEVNRANADRVRPDFSKHQMDNDRLAPRTSSEGDLLDRLLPDEND